MKKNVRPAKNDPMDGFPLQRVSARFAEFERNGFMKRVFVKRAFLFVSFLLLIGVPLPGRAQDHLLTYEPLINRLARDGLDSHYLLRIFDDPRSEPLPSLTMVSLFPREVPDAYRQFLTPESIQRVKTFLRANEKLLAEMEDRFHVEKEVVVAILLIESRFGENVGQYRVIPALASMTLLDVPENLWCNFLTLWGLNPEISFEGFRERAQKRAQWAYEELKCFLRIARQETTDPLEIRGSYAGALGMAQFVPSSYLTFAFRQKNLEYWIRSKEEAVFSIANYLKSHGWKRSLSRERKKRVLWFYNHSNPYVETVLEIAGRIKNRQRTSSR